MTLNPKIKLAFASGTEDLNRRLIEHVRAIYPELPLWVVSDFPPEDPGLKWIRYRVNRPFAENLRRCREELRGHEIRLAAVMLVPNVPFRRMRLLALVLSPRGFLAFNENLNHFMLRPGSMPAIARHIAWRGANALRWSVRTARKTDWARVARYAAASVAGVVGQATAPAGRGRMRVAPSEPRPLRERLTAGVTVVIPSRTGKELLQAQLPGILAQAPAQIVVVDNGSTDDTAAWLASTYPQIEVVHSPAPLSFARAVNRGIARARCRYVCLLNNDMLLEPGFFAALRTRLPTGSRPLQRHRADPISRRVSAVKRPARLSSRSPHPPTSRCAAMSPCPARMAATCSTAAAAARSTTRRNCTPWAMWTRSTSLPTWKISISAIAPGSADGPAYTWPARLWSIAIAPPPRATTAKTQLAHILEINYLRFVARAVSDSKVFRRLWAQALRRLFLLKGPLDRAAGIALRGRSSRACGLLRGTLPRPHRRQRQCFSGSSATGGKPRVLVASPYVPFPLSHGGAVRMYNLMRRAAEEFDLVLVAFTEHAAPPPAEVLAICAEVVLVRRAGSHSLPFTGRPEVVEEFASPSFRAALQQTVRKWSPAIAQLEFTQLAQYAPDCAPARTILVEHDITFDLYEQLLRLDDRWELRRELDLWRKFETAAWRTWTA